MTPSRSFRLATALLASAVLSADVRTVKVSPTYTRHASTNCYRGHGGHIIDSMGNATDIGPPPSACHRRSTRCNNNESCACALRKQVDLNSTHLDFFIRAAAAAAPPARRFGFGFPVARSPKVSLGPCDR